MSQAVDGGPVRPRRWRSFGLLAATTAAALALLAGTVAATDFKRVRAAGGASASAAGWVADYWWVFGVVEFWGLVALAVAHAAVRDAPLLRCARLGWVVVGVVPPCIAAAVTWWASAAAG